jgi:DNA-binding MarR family transcriptional regulator
VDRLEQAGFVRRRRDLKDRRRVIVEPQLDEMERCMPPLFQAMGQAMTAVCSHYSDEELALILDYVTRSRDVLYEAARKLGKEAPGASVARPQRQDREPGGATRT